MVHLITVLELGLFPKCGVTVPDPSFAGGNHFCRSGAGNETKLTPNSITVSYNVGVSVYFEWNARAHTESYEDPLLQELLKNADSGELGSSDLQLLSLPLSLWKDVEHPVNFCIPAVPSESVRAAEEAYHPYSTHWEDELLLQASQAFSQEHEEEEDALLLAASQDYEKRCGPLMTSDDVQSAVVAQVPLNTKRNNN